jgi:hypothetical protein
VDLGDPVLEVRAFDILLNLAIPENAFQSDELPLLEEVETALRDTGVIAPVGPNQMLSAAASSIPVAFSFDTPDSAIALQLLYRVEPDGKLERTMVTFNDLNGSLQLQTAHYQRDRQITLGERLEVDTPIGKRVVEVLAIKKSELKSYGSEDTRRNVTVDVRF